MTGDVPWPESEEELLEFIREQVDITFPDINDPDAGGLSEPESPAAQAYAKSADALWRCAAAAFYYACKQVKPSSSQAGFATLRLLRELHIGEGPLHVVALEHALYPQYDLREKVNSFIMDNAEWLRERAKEKLEEEDNAAPFVREHWEGLVDGEPP